MQGSGTTVPVTHRTLLPVDDGEGRVGCRGTFGGPTNRMPLSAQFQRWLDVWQRQHSTVAHESMLQQPLLDLHRGHDCSCKTQLSTERRAQRHNCRRESLVGHQSANVHNCAESRLPKMTHRLKAPAPFSSALCQIIHLCQGHSERGRECDDSNEQRRRHIW
jgi:hypothetical protein